MLVESICVRVFYRLSLIVFCLEMSFHVHILCIMLCKDYISRHLVLFYDGDWSRLSKWYLVVVW